MRRLARPDRFRPGGRPGRAFPQAVRFTTPGLAEASSLARGLASRPRAASRHPGEGALVESTIYGSAVTAPPSTWIAAPFTYEAAGERRKAATRPSPLLAPPTTNVFPANPSSTGTSYAAAALRWRRGGGA